MPTTLRVLGVLVALVVLAPIIEGPATGDDTMAPHGAPPVGDAPSQTQQAETSPPPVLFFYYGWYGDGKHGRHWRDGLADVPKAGHYDSHSLDDTRHQFRAMRDAGGTGAIVSWWGTHSYEEKSLRLAVEAAEKEGMKVTAHFEAESRDFVDASPERIAGELATLWHRHAQSDAWLRVDGRPALFVHGASMRPVEHWQAVFRILREDGIEFHAYGEARNVAHAPLYEAFDGLYYYMPVELQAGRVFGAANWEMRKLADAKGREWLPTVAPAYDNSHDRLKRDHVVVDWDDGRLIRDGWRRALELRPPFVLLATWNEWHEGSSFEPGVEDDGRRLAILKDLMAGGDGFLDR